MSETVLTGTVKIDRIYVDDVNILLIVQRSYNTRQIEVLEPVSPPKFIISSSANFGRLQIVRTDQLFCIE